MGFWKYLWKEFQAEGTAGEPQGRQRETQRKSLKMWPEVSETSTGGTRGCGEKFRFYSRFGRSFLVIFTVLSIFSAVLGLCYFMWASSSCGKWVTLWFGLHRLLTAVTYPVVEHGL